MSSLLFANPWHYFFSERPNTALRAAPTPRKEKTNSSQGEVPKKPSRLLPRKTPMNTNAAIVAPTCEKWAKARKKSLFIGDLSLSCRLLKTAPSFSLHVINLITNIKTVSRLSPNLVLLRFSMDISSVFYPEGRRTGDGSVSYFSYRGWGMILCPIFRISPQFLYSPLLIC